MHILLLTDTQLKRAPLARCLDALGPSLLIDLLDPEQQHIRPDPASVRAIVSDVSFTTSAAIGPLRQHLDRLRSGRAPYVCLLREDTPRARAQAHALGAVQALDSTQVFDILVDLLPALSLERAEVAASVGTASASLTRMFELGRNGGVIEPPVIVNAAMLIETALRNSDVRAWLDLVWSFDNATHQHCLLVAVLAAAFGKQLGLRPSDCQKLTQAALLHDVGKCLIPHSILNKPGRLTLDERRMIEMHPLAGYELLSDHGYSNEMLSVVRSHHEYLDGSGYPDGLTSGGISDLVRLVTICDIFAALIERRPYRAPMMGAEAYEIIKSMNGKLDSDFVRAFQPLAEHQTQTVRPSSAMRAN